MFQLKKLVLATLISSSVFFSQAAVAAPVDLSQETKQYQTFVIEQIDELVKGTEQFVAALKTVRLKRRKNCIH